MSYQLQARQQLGRITDGMGALLARAKAEGRGLTAGEAQQFDKLESRGRQLNQQIDRGEAGTPRGAAVNEFPTADLVAELRDTFNLSPAQLRARRREMDPTAKAFSAYLRGGMESLDPDQRGLMNFQPGLGPQNAQTTLPGSGGGYTVPQGFSQMLEEAQRFFGGILEVAGEIPTETGAPLPYPTIDDSGNEGRLVGENVQNAETDMVFGQVTYGAYIFSSDVCLVPLALAQDSFFDMDSLVARLLGTRLGRLQNRKFSIGAGGGTEPAGLVTELTSASLTYPFASGSVTTIKYADLLGLEHSVDPSYRRAATWMFSDATLKLLKGILDKNDRPLWQAGLTASFANGAAVIGSGKPTILGYPYIINPRMADPAASAKTITFGDHSRFKIRRAGQPTVLRLVERYADYLQIGYIAFLRADSKLLDAGTHPLYLGVQAAN